MRVFGELGRWVADNFLGTLLRDFFSDYLELLGVTSAVAALVAPLLGLYAARLVVELVTPPPEVNWANLNPDDMNVMGQSFDDLHVAMSLAKKLNEDVAENLEEFTDQVRRLGLYGKHSVWDRVDIDDHEFIAGLYHRPDFAKALAEMLGTTTADSEEEFLKQIREYRTRKI